MAIDWTDFQSDITDLLVNELGAIPCTIKFLDGSTTNTYVVFSQGDIDNIDNRQNPTPLMGLSQQLAYVPGTVRWSPDPGGELQYMIGSTRYIKRISKVSASQPTNVPLVYVLVVE